MQSDALRATLARNLRKKIEHDLGPGSRWSVRAWALSRELDVRLIDRLVKGEHAVTIDKLDELAVACGLQPWQLLLPDFDPASPADAPISEGERDMLKKLRRLLHE
jgi:ACT domain-containing protein